MCRKLCRHLIRLLFCRQAKGALASEMVCEKEEETKHKALDGKDRVEVLLKMCELHRKRHEFRGGFEWKMHVALWSGLGLMAGTLATGKGDVSTDSFTVMWVGLIILGVAFSVIVVVVHLWLSGMDVRYASDQEQGIEAMDAAKGQVDLEPLLRPPGAGDFAYVHRLQELITVCLMFLVLVAFVWRSWPQVPRVNETRTTSVTTTQPGVSKTCSTSRTESIVMEPIKGADQ